MEERYSIDVFSRFATCTNDKVFPAILKGKRRTVKT